MTIDNFGKPGYVGNPFRAPLNHPLADTISYFQEPSALDCFEAAFFMDGKWVTEIIPELALWAESDFGDEEMASRVYRFIPNDVVYTFLVRFELDRPNTTL